MMVINEIKDQAMRFPKYTRGMASTCSEHMLRFRLAGILLRLVLWTLKPTCAPGASAFQIFAAIGTKNIVFTIEIRSAKCVPLGSKRVKPRSQEGKIINPWTGQAA